MRESRRFRHDEDMAVCSKRFSAFDCQWHPADTGLRSEWCLFSHSLAPEDRPCRLFMPPTALLHLLRTTPTLAVVPNRAILYVSGSQSSEFLNGLLATTVPNAGRGPFYSAVLHAQVRIRMLEMSPSYTNSTIGESDA